MNYRWLRRMLVGVLAIVLVAAGGAWLLASRIDRDAVAARAAAEVKSATGRDFAIDGAVRLQFFPALALVAEDVRLGNAAWGSRPDMLRARRLALNVALRPLLSRRIEVGRIELSGADLLLETNAQGEANWRFRRAGETPPSASDVDRKIRVTVAELLAQDSSLSFRSARAGTTRTLAIDSLALGRGEAAGGTAEGLDKLVLTARYRDQPVHVEGRVGALRTVAVATALPVDLALSIAGTSATLKGELGLREQAGQARLKVEARVEQAGALGQVLGVALPAALPLPASVKATLAWDRQHLRADPMEWSAASQSLGGKLDWDRGAVPPALHVALRADGLDLARLAPPRATPAAGAGRLVPDMPLPQLAPIAMDLSGELIAERLVLPGGIELGALRARASMAGDRIEVPSLSFGVARGTVDMSGTARVAAGQAPAISARLKARHVAMDALLALARRKNALLTGGRTEIDADLRGNGATLQRLAASLDGEIRLRMGPATAAGQSSAPQDLLAAFVRALTPNHAQQSEPIRIQCAAARLPLHDGVIEVDRSIAMETDKLSIVMAGRIDLGSEALELAIRPSVRKGLGLQPGNFADVVKIGGTLAHPAVQVDVLGTAREAASLSAAVASSGVSLLAERLLKQSNHPHPCQAALGGATDDARRQRNDKARGVRPLAPLKELFGR